MPRVLLATFQLMPEGEYGGDLLGPLAARGIDAAWAVWSDPSVDWAQADLVAVRSTWDYHRRLPEFLDWSRRVASTSTLLNGVDVFTWNADKAYLIQLVAHVATVPTELVDEQTLVPALAAAAERWGTFVLKPRVGASGLGLVVLTGPEDARLQALLPGPWIVQPLIASVRTRGEHSVYVFAGQATSQVEKRPGAGGDEVRVHDLYGGGSRSVPLDPDLAAVAEAAVRAVEPITGVAPAYARVDLMWWQDQWVVSELELIEPGLHLDIAPANADHFADLVRSRLTGLTFRAATEADVEELVALVESAYRGESSRSGWTTEADLLHGRRTDAASVHAVITTPGSRMIVAEDATGRIVACCQLEERDQDAQRIGYFGMFAVRPGRQGAGLGRRVLAEAERVARGLGATELHMTVIVQREDLIGYYVRRGYRRTGVISAFPYGEDRFGVPQRDDLAFELLVKQL